MDAVSREKTREVVAEINAAVLEILEKHNLKLTKQTGKFGDEFGYTVSASAIQVNEDGINILSPEVVAYQRNGYWAYWGKAGVDSDYTTLTAPIGTKFVSNGKTFAFAGIKSRGKLKIIGVETVSKQSFLFADSIAKKLNEAGGVPPVKREVTVKEFTPRVKASK